MGDWVLRWESGAEDGDQKIGGKGRLSFEIGRVIGENESQDFKMEE